MKNDDTETANKIRRLVVCLAIGEPPDEARRLLSAGNGFAMRGKYPLLTPEDIAKLYYPHEPEKRTALAQKVERDIAQGILPCPVKNCTPFEALALWINRPAIAPDHPLADVLPPGPAAADSGQRSISRSEFDAANNGMKPANDLEEFLFQVFRDSARRILWPIAGGDRFERFEACAPLFSPDIRSLATTALSTGDTRQLDAAVDRMLYNLHADFGYETAKPQSWKEQEAGSSTAAPVVAPSEQQEPRRPAERRDGLSIAVTAALEELRTRLNADPTAGQVFEYLAEHDQTGIIEDSTDEKLIWRAADGTMKDTAFKSLQNRLTTAKKKNPW